MLNYCNFFSNPRARMGEGLLKIMRRGSTTKADYLTVPPVKLLWIRLKKLRGGISFDNVAASVEQGSKTQSFRHFGSFIRRQPH